MKREELIAALKFMANDGRFTAIADQAAAMLEQDGEDIARMRRATAKMFDEDLALKCELSALAAKVARLREALGEATEAIAWMQACTSPAEDEVEKALASARAALKESSNG